MIDALLNNDVDLSSQDYEGKTALHYAAAHGNIGAIEKIFQTLIRNNQYDVINIKDSEGKTALHHACESTNPNIASLLIDTQNINLDEPDQYGLTPITTAYITNKENIFNQLLEAGAKIGIDTLDFINQRKDKKSLRNILKNNSPYALKVA